MPADRSTRRTSVLFVAVFTVIAVLGLVAAVLVVRSDDSDPPRPGSIVSATPIGDAPAGSVGWTIVYRTTTASGAPALSSGTVYASTSPAPSGGRFVVAWAHPTLGTGQDCTPSRAADPSTAIPGFAQMMANGWVVASTDYTGLGTDGVLPYLIGEGEAHNVIDSVRAARAIEGTGAGTTYVAWGHSQGGHASLFTGDVAGRYAPELTLVGVAAAAPAAELSSLVQLQWQDYVSWVIGSEVITLWPQFYPQLSASQIATPLAQQQAPTLGAVCITSNPTALLQTFGPVLTQPFFSVDPTTVSSWRTELDANTPQPVAKIPVYVAQGLLDTVVLPSTTAQLDVGWCAQGAAVTMEWFPTADHFSVPAAAAPSAVVWMAQLFAGQPAGNTCAQTPPVAPATAPPTP